MIVLDTNVISEIMALQPSDAVTRWLSSQSASDLFTTTTTQAEILYGIRILPDGKRRQSLEIAAQAIFSEDMNGRVLAFDAAAADVYARIAARRRRLGKPMSQFDAQIAAIALSHGCSVATRNAVDFQNIDLVVINPWDHGR